MVWLLQKFFVDAVDDDHNIFAVDFLDTIQEEWLDNDNVVIYPPKISSPHVRTLTDIMDDEIFANNAKLPEYDLLKPLNLILGECPIYTYVTLQPPPEPQPSENIIENVPPRE